MHELGILVAVVRSVEAIVHEQQLTKVDTLVLQIGELASVVPHYIEQCYPAAVHGTLLEETLLRIEILPANGRCKACGKVFHVVSNHRICPDCGQDSWELLGGREFMIKEIVAC